MTGGFIEPAMPPPPGMTSNFIDPDYCGIRLLVVNCVFLPLAVISFAIRSWTRLFVVRSFRIDDCENPLSWIIGYENVLTYGNRFDDYGIGGLVQ